MMKGLVFNVSVWTMQAAVDRSGILVGMWGAGTLAYTLIATIVRPFSQSKKPPKFIQPPCKGLG